MSQCCAVYAHFVRGYTDSSLSDLRFHLSWHRMTRNWIRITRYLNNSKAGKMSSVPPVSSISNGLTIILKFICKYNVIMLREESLLTATFVATLSRLPCRSAYIISTCRPVKRNNSSNYIHSNETYARFGAAWVAVVHWRDLVNETSHVYAARSVLISHTCNRLSTILDFVFP